MINLTAEPLPLRGRTLVNIPAGRVPVGLAMLNGAPALMVANTKTEVAARTLAVIIIPDAGDGGRDASPDTYIGSLRRDPYVLHVFLVAL